MILTSIFAIGCIAYILYVCEYFTKPHWIPIVTITFAILSLIIIVIYDIHEYVLASFEDEKHKSDENDCMQFFVQLMQMNNINPENEEEVTWIEQNKNDE
jgi:TRAP-type mannitol/chloroaromatic compound transport system permease small subunit